MANMFVWYRAAVVCDALEMVMITSYIVLDQLYTNFPVDTCALVMGLATQISLCLALCRCQMAVTPTQWKIGLGMLTVLKCILFGMLMFTQLLAPNRAFWVQAIGYLVLSPLLLTGSVFNVAQLVEMVLNPDLIEENNTSNVGVDQDGGRAGQSNHDGKECGMSKEVKARVEFLGDGFVDVEMVKIAGKTKLRVVEMEDGVPKQQEYLI